MLAEISSKSSKGNACHTFGQEKVEPAYNTTIGHAQNSFEGYKFP
jgi:hypothetical protein